MSNVYLVYVSNSGYLPFYGANALWFHFLFDRPVDSFDYRLPGFI